MPSSFKTDKLQLNFWANIDRPVRSDFNRDNAIIDSAVGDHIENTLVHLTDDDRSKLRDTYQIRVLQGTDEDVRELTLSSGGSGGIELSGSRVIIRQTTTGQLRYDLNNSSCQYVLIAVR